MRSHEWILIICCFLFCLILTGCQPKQSILLQNTICQFPCWQSIQPGISTSEEAIKILKDLPFIDYPPTRSPRKVNDVKSYTSWIFINKYKETSGSITFFNNIVAEISFSVNRISFGEMINFYGEPEYVSIISGWADSQWLQVYLLYPSQGVLIVHFDRSWRPVEDMAHITSNISVFEVIYFDPKLYDQLVESEFFHMANQATIVNSIHRWSGFGEYQYTEQIIR